MNSTGTRRLAPRTIIVVSLLWLNLCLTASAQVLTRSYDNFRSGANTKETTISSANVANLRKLRELALSGGDDPRIEAQPLYVPHLQMADGQSHDVLFVSTMANNVYAFDVNDGLQLWRTSLGNPISPAITGRTQFGQNETEIDLWGVNQRWGILSTPVIDIDSNTLYVVNWTSPDGARKNAVHKLNALNITNGKAVHEPLFIQAAAGAHARFNSPNQKQRAALLLTPLHQSTGNPIKKTLFMACGMTSENAKGDHGWVVAFDVDSFRQTAAWTSTRKTHAGGIWQAGQGPASDDEGNIYFMTSNGGWNGKTDFGESFVKLKYKQASLSITDWFTPFIDEERPKQAANGYDFTDQDLGSAGPLLPEGTNLLVGAGKDGILYVLDRNNLGKKLVDQNRPSLAGNKSLLNAVFFTYFPGTFALNPLVNVNSFPDGKTHHLHGSPISWKSDAHGEMLFVWGENAPLRSWTLAPDGKIKFVAESQETASAFSTVFNAMPGGMITLSANGGNNGIIWGSVPVKGNWNGRDNNGNANQEIVEGVLRAYDASNIDGTNTNGNPRMRLLWQSTNPGLPHPNATRFTYNKFCPPVVADGKVFLTTYDGRIIVYGL